MLEVATSNGLGGDAFTRNTLFDHHTKRFWCSLHRVTNAPAKFKVATSNGLEGDALKENT